MHWNNERNKTLTTCLELVGDLWSSNPLNATLIQIMCTYIRVHTYDACHVNLHTKALRQEYYTSNFACSTVATNMHTITVIVLNGNGLTISSRINCDCLMGLIAIWFLSIAENSVQLYTIYKLIQIILTPIRPKYLTPRAAPRNSIDDKET